jgi:alpha-beta hydrolase superfamily lysophospholipase
MMEKAFNMNNDAINGLAFTASVTVASQALILRDRLLGRVKRVSLDHSADLNVSIRTISSGGQLLDAVFAKPVKEQVRASIVLCHGIGETVEHWFGVQRLLSAQGVASLVFDYAGFGRSTGRIRWEQCEEDAIAAFHALKALLPDTPISMLGFSLGSGIAAAVLDRISPTHLVLCSSFTSFQAATCCAGLPRRLSFLAPPIWNTEESLCRYSLPVLVLHSEQDRLFPTQMASRLASCNQERTQLSIISDQQHNDPFRCPKRRYWDHVVSFLQSDLSRAEE